MEQPGTLSIILIVVAAAFLAYALWVRFAGGSRPLNFVQYSRVRDAAALHRWIGHRLLLLPTVSLIGAAVAPRVPALALPLVLAWAMTVVGIVLWLAASAGRFQDAR
jgi:hypothetical protein